MYVVVIVVIASVIVILIAIPRLKIMDGVADKGWLRVRYVRVPILAETFQKNQTTKNKADSGSNEAIHFESKEILKRISRYGCTALYGLDVDCVYWPSRVFVTNSGLDMLYDSFTSSLKRECVCILPKCHLSEARIALLQCWCNSVFQFTSRCREGS